MSTEEEKRRTRNRVAKFRMRRRRQQWGNGQRKPRGNPKAVAAKLLKRAEEMAKYGYSGSLKPNGF